MPETVDNSIEGISLGIGKASFPEHLLLIKDTVINIDNPESFIAVAVDENGDLATGTIGSDMEGVGFGADFYPQLHMAMLIFLSESEDLAFMLDSVFRTNLKYLPSEYHIDNASSFVIVPRDENYIVGTVNEIFYKIDPQKFGNPSAKLDISQVESFDFFGANLSINIGNLLFKDNNTFDYFPIIKTTPLRDILSSTQLEMYDVLPDETIPEWMERKGYQLFVVPFESEAAAGEFYTSLSSMEYAEAFEAAEVKLAEKTTNLNMIGDGVALGGILFTDSEGTEHYSFGTGAVITGKVSTPEIRVVGFPEVRVSCNNTLLTDIYYTTDGSDPKTNGILYTERFSCSNNTTVRAIAKVGEIWSEEATPVTVALHVGDTITLDKIKVYVLAAKDEDGTWSSAAEAAGVEYIGVDKNHDLSYYVNGSDWVDLDDYDTSPGTFGYEWGGYGTETGIQDTAVGTGLNNTNQLISKNLQPDTSGWWVVWDKVEEFRQSHSDKWFVPSKDELKLFFENKANLSNLSLNTNSYYWSSSEYSSTDAWLLYFISGGQGDYSKSRHYFRVRLCRYITSSDFYIKKTWTTNELITATELNRIENRIKELHSSYEPHNWADEELITAERLNSIETQLETNKTWIENELITKEKLNNIEDQLI